MSDQIVKSQLYEVQVFLEKTVDQIERYLNRITIQSLLEEKQGDQAYFEGLLSNLRRILVYCEEGLDACIVEIQHTTISKSRAEKTLSTIFRHCIVEFFSPKYDLWYEDSPSTYTGDDVIRFRQEPPKSFTELIREIEGEFLTIREELDYYGSSFTSKTVQQ